MSQLPSEEKPLFKVEYRIERDLTDDGLPMYALYKHWSNPFHDGSNLIAKNADRGILERAIAFLQEGV